jgi:hypothetical protein
LRNKYRPKGRPESFDQGEGAYDEGEMLFPTKSTFVIQGMMPGHIGIGFLPKGFPADSPTAVKILHDGQDITKSGINAKPGQEIKDVTVVIGTK